MIRYQPGQGKICKKILLNKRLYLNYKTTIMKNLLTIIVFFFFSIESFSQVKTKGKIKINVKKEAKALERDGWESTSTYPLSAQYQRLIDAEQETNEDGDIVNLVGLGEFSGNSKSIAMQTSATLAKADIGGQIESSIKSVTKIDQVNDNVAQSLEDALIVTTQLVSQKITGKPILQMCKTEKKGGRTIYSCRSQYKMNFDAASRMHVQLMRDELNRKKAQDVRDEYEAFFKDGLYDKVRDDISDGEAQE